MLDIQPTSQTPKYAFGMHDEIVVQGISYRPQARRDWGYILARTDHTGVAESFDAGKLAHLVQKGLLRHNKGAFLPADIRDRELKSSTIISGLDGRVAEAMEFRSGFVEAFLELEAEGAVNRTDSAVLRATKKLQRRAAEIRGLIAPDKRQTGKDECLPKMPHESTLLRWVRTYEADGMEGLCDAKCRSGRKSRQIGLEELALIGPIVDGYADPSQPSQKTIFDRVEAAFEDANAARSESGLAPLVMPSRETIRLEIKRLDPYHTYRVRHGESAGRKTFAPVGKGVQVTRPLERVEVDEWTIDLMSYFAQTGVLEHFTDEEKEKLGLNDKKIRWIVTAAICATTRCIVAMRLSRTANNRSATQTLEMITRDKGVWADVFGARSPWNMAGVPELIVTDNGGAFISVQMRAAMQDLGIRAERTPTGLPELRSRIERVFRTMSTSLMPLLSGRTFSDVVSKGDSDPEERAALTPEELSEALVRWVVDVYHNRPHEGLNGETPANCWNRLVEIYGVQPPPDMRRRRLVFGTRLERTLTKKGIEVLGVYYHSEALARWMLRTNDRTLPVRWYFQDIGAIEVNVDGEWLEVPSVIEELDGVSSEVWHGAVRSLRASFQREAAVSRPILLQAIRDIEAMNGRAMQRQGLIVQDWSPENLKKIEDRLMIGFDVRDDVVRQADVGSDGYDPLTGTNTGTQTTDLDDLLSGGTNSKASHAQSSTAHLDGPADDDWTNESK